MDTHVELEVVKARLAELQSTHRGLDLLLRNAQDDPAQNDLQIRRLKKQKLKLKDEITILERQLVPDVPA